MFLKLKTILNTFTEGFKETSVRAIEKDLKEMENAFALCIVGSLAGIPAPPNYLSLLLLPHLEREIKVMIVRSEGHDDRLAEWMELADL
ncbi:MAG: hypothetical protein GY909_19310 [Oligoflexia bacterium]|nr:hypothetical protein [Oligoflexia bacterium]